MPKRQPRPPVAETIALAKARDAWLKSIEATAAAKTLTIKRAAIAALVDYLGASKPVHAIARPDLARFYQHLRNGGAATPTIFNKQSYLGGAGGFFAWAMASGYYPAGDNPAKGHIRYTTKEKRQRKKHGFKAFDLEQVRTLYAPENFARLSPGARWAALLGLYTGARASEVGQLLTVDVATVDDVPAIRITDDGEGQKLKTEASNRVVPIHADLLALGFLDYVNSLRGRGDWRIFPQASATAKNGAGNWISKAFGYYLGTTGKDWPEAKRGFHSLRKTVIQELQGAGVSSELRAQLVGHELEDEHHATYSRAFTAAEKLKGAGKSPGLSVLAYGLDLDALRPLLTAAVSRRRASTPGRRWLLNPLFRILAGARAREVLTAGALLVVLGAALLMQLGGLSMAMGAFLAGVLLSESSFRHQLQADVEPFRGILLGLFFLGVGMALDLSVVRAHWPTIVVGVLAMMATKGVCIYVVARMLRGSHGEAMDRAALMAQGGEFAFVLYAAAVSSGVISTQANASLTSIVVLSMALTPLVTLLVQRLVPACRPAQSHEMDAAVGLSGSVLMIGFGRFGQVVSQSLLARDVDVTIIDTDIKMIQAGSDFGFKIYYGDGTRLDVLEAAGANHAKVIAVCVDQPQDANCMVELCKAHFPQATLLVRAYDREHAWHLAGEGVTFHVRETFESALQFGTLALRQLGVTPVEAARITDDVRQRDADRFAYELAGGDWVSGAVMSFSKRPHPLPLTQPRRQGRALNEAAEVAAHSRT